MSRFVKPKAPPTKGQVFLKKWLGTPIRGTINPALKEPLSKRKKVESGPRLEPSTPAEQKKITRKLKSFEEELARELSGGPKNKIKEDVKFKRPKRRKKKLSAADRAELRRELGGKRRAKP